MTHLTITFSLIEKKRGSSDVQSKRNKKHHCSKQGKTSHLFSSEFELINYNIISIILGLVPEVANTNLQEQTDSISEPVDEEMNGISAGS